MNYLSEEPQDPDMENVSYLKTKLKSCLGWVAYHSGAFLLLRFIHRHLFGTGIRILYYHRVNTAPVEPHLLGPRPLTADEFDRHLRHLRRFYRVISLEEAAAALASDRPLPSNAVVLTFDDGYRDNFTVALPLLERYKLPATLFVVSGAMDGKPLWLDLVDAWFAETTVPSLRFNRITSELRLTTPAERLQALRLVRAVLKTIPTTKLAPTLAELRAQLGVSGPDRQPADRAMLNWDELRSMGRSPLITIGAHTVNHPILTHLEPAEIREEIEESCRRITQELGKPVRFFAYPDGAYNSTAQSVVHQAGLVACATKGGGFNPAGFDLTALKRLGAEGIPQFRLALYLAGWEDLREVLGRQLNEWYRSLKRLTYSVMEAAGIFPFLRYLHREQLIVLLYHGVNRDDPAAHLDNLHVPGERFRRQMRWLRKKFTPISLDQALAAFDGRGALPPRAVLVSFDDAYRNNQEVAWPILKELGIPAVLFVPTEFINRPQSYWAEELERRIISTRTLAIPWDSELLWLRTFAERRSAFRKIADGLKRLGQTERERAWEELQRQLPCEDKDPTCPLEPRLTWDEMRTLSQDGMAIGSHTTSHSPLPSLSSDRIILELEGSRNELESRLGTRVLSFAYPNGDWNPAVRRLAEQAGYSCAFTSQPGTNDSHTDRFLLRRIPINATNSFSEFVSAVSGFSRLGARRVTKIVEIGNYPPPQCGWAIQTQLLTEELRRRGASCQVMNINESRKIKSPEYVDVQNGGDYLLKLLGFTLLGYRPHTHVNAESTKGFLLTLAANLAGSALGRPAVMTFHGGASQRYFPRTDSYFLRLAYRLLFLSAGSITCDSIEIQRVIQSYGINGTPIASIPCFSLQNLGFEARPLAAPIEEFLRQRSPVFFCFVCFRPEYGLDTVLDAMQRFTKQQPRAGFIWLGFPAKEVPPAEAYVDKQPGGRPENLLLLGNLEHETFMTLLKRCFAYLRPHVRDGVSASVLESLALGVPVIAADNGMRPPGVVTYRFEDAADLCAKLEHVVKNYDAVKRATQPLGIDDNIERIAEWLLAQGNDSKKPTDAPSDQI